MPHIDKAILAFNKRQEPAHQPASATAPKEQTTPKEHRFEEAMIQIDLDSPRLGKETARGHEARPASNATVVLSGQLSSPKPRVENPAKDSHEAHPASGSPVALRGLQALVSDYPDVLERTIVAALTDADVHYINQAIHGISALETMKSHSHPQLHVVETLSVASVRRAMRFFGKSHGMCPPFYHSITLVLRQAQCATRSMWTPTHLQ